MDYTYGSYAQPGATAQRESVYGSQHLPSDFSGYRSEIYRGYQQQSNHDVESPGASRRPNKHPRLDPQSNSRTTHGYQAGASNGHRTLPSLSQNSSTSRSGQAHQSSATLEQQIRGLASYTNTPASYGNGTAGPASPSAPTPAPSGGLPPGLEYSPSGEILPQRGAAPGTILRLACMYCDRKKRKCPRDWPCGECKKDGQTCIPKIRQYQRPNPPTGPELDAQAEGDSDDAAATTEGQGSTSAKPLRDESKRKEIVRMGPVVGGCQEWSNMRLAYSPWPPSLDDVREKMFHMEESLLFTSQQWADYWPHMTNVYTRQIRPVVHKNGATVEMWECRNHKLRRLKGKEFEGPRKRNRLSKLHLLESEVPCKIRIRVVYFIKHAKTDEAHNLGLGSCRCIPDWVLFERTGQVLTDMTKHNHTLETMDRFKRCDALPFFGAQKVQEEGYGNAPVRRWIQEKYGSYSKQVEFLTISDVANASKFWRKQHPTLELLDVIPDEDPVVDARKRALDSIGTTAPEGLRKALAEVFKQLPAAIEIALPFLQTAQEAGAPSNSAGVLEGVEITGKIPHPGYPSFGWKDTWSPDQTEPVIGHRLVTATKNAASVAPFPPAPNPAPALAPALAPSPATLRPPAQRGTVPQNVATRSTPYVPPQTSSTEDSATRHNPILAPRTVTQVTPQMPAPTPPVPRPSWASSATSEPEKGAWRPTDIVSVIFGGPSTSGS